MKKALFLLLVSILFWFDGKSSQSGSFLPRRSWLCRCFLSACSKRHRWVSKEILRFPMVHHSSS
ncbi:MAG: hypothetical protein AAGM67_18175, partial [Bacteroidota bacterium]